MNMSTSAAAGGGSTGSSILLDRQNPLLSVETSLKVREEPDVKFVDGSWFLQGRNGREEYENGPRIPGARYFDVDQIASTGEILNPKGLPHMMPGRDLFAASMDAMDLKDDDHLIVYATKGCVGFHRTWFQLRAMGHASNRLHLMDGSLDDWKEKGGPIEEGKKEALIAKNLDLTKKPFKYGSASDATNVVDIEQVKSIVMGNINNNSDDEESSLIVDARSADRFFGRVNEPRAGVRSGHMPGAKVLFFMDLLDPQNPTRFKEKKELQKIIEDAIGVEAISTKKKIITTCGSGITACAVACALEICGRDPKDTYVYDGSWTEWGGESDTAVVK